MLFLCFNIFLKKVKLCTNKLEKVFELFQAKTPAYLTYFINIFL